MDTYHESLISKGILFKLTSMIKDLPLKLGTYKYSLFFLNAILPMLFFEIINPGSASSWAIFSIASWWVRDTKINQ